MKKKAVLALGLRFLLLSMPIAGFLNVASAQQHMIADYKLSNVEWTLPSDGTTPRIIKWQGSVTLDNGAQLTFNERDVTPLLFSVDFIQIGDQFDIVNEGLFPDNLERSYYHLKLPKTNAEVDLQGPSGILTHFLRAKAGQLSLERVHILWNEKPESEPIREARFYLGGDYLRMPIESEKYHGLYSQMPVQIISEDVISPPNDELGRSQKKVSFQQLNAYGKPIGAIYTATTSPMSMSTKNPIVTRVEYFDKNWIYNEKYRVYFLKSWTMRIALDTGLIVTVGREDNSGSNRWPLGYKYKANLKVWHPNMWPEPYAPFVEDEVHQGDEVVVEEFFDSHTRSRFGVKDVQSGFYSDQFWGDVYNPKK